MFGGFQGAMCGQPVYYTPLPAHAWENSALRLGNPFGCIPRPILPDWLRGQARRLRLVPPPGR